MRKSVLVLVLFAAAAIYGTAETASVASPIAEAHLFKNGLAAVRRAVEIPAPGTYRIDTIAKAVHGTLWVNAPASVTLRSGKEDVDVPLDGRTPPALGPALAGSQVTLFFRESSLPPVTGTVVDIAALSEGAQRFVVLQSGSDLSYVDLSTVAYANVRNAPESTRESRPVMWIDVDETGAFPMTLSITYLVRGLSWAPSYFVDISDPKELAIRQQAVIRNELDELEAVDVMLISGYPGIQFDAVTSPLVPDASWTEFMQQLQQGGHEPAPHAMTQQLVLSNAAGVVPWPDLGANPLGEGPDLHYQPAGTISLATGEALAIETAQAKSPYRRLVEWNVNGDNDLERPRMWDGGYDPRVEPIEGDPWDVVEFDNPFPFPMTTGPAYVVAGGRVQGQQLSHWANAGETTRLRVTKALSIRTSATEHEVAGPREQVSVAGRLYQKTTVEGELRTSNHRAESVDLAIRRRFSGELVSADGDPQSRLLEEGVRSLNPRNELVWQRTLAPGAEDALRYRYTVLIPR